MRLQSGGVAVFSPTSISSEVKETVASLGELKYIIAPDFEVYIMKFFRYSLAGDLILTLLLASYQCRPLVRSLSKRKSHWTRRAPSEAGEDGIREGSL